MRRKCAKSQVVSGFPKLFTGFCAKFQLLCTFYHKIHTLIEILHRIDEKTRKNHTLVEKMNRNRLKAIENWANPHNS